MDCMKEQGPRTRPQQQQPEPLRSPHTSLTMTFHGVEVWIGHLLSMKALIGGKL